MTKKPYAKWNIDGISRSLTGRFYRAPEESVSPPILVCSATYLHFHILRLFHPRMVRIVGHRSVHNFDIIRSVAVLMYRRLFDLLMGLNVVPRGYYNSIIVHDFKIGNAFSNWRFRICLILVGRILFRIFLLLSVTKANGFYHIEKVDQPPRFRILRICCKKHNLGANKAIATHISLRPRCFSGVS
jgi:hypothetical protein